MDETLAKWLDDAAVYFENRPTGGEDRAHWANVANAENARKTATALRALADENRRYQPWEVALDAYTMADAMLAERAKGE